MLAGLGVWMMVAVAADPRITTACQYRTDQKSCAAHQLEARDALRVFARQRGFDLTDPRSPARAYSDGPLEMKFLFRCRKRYRGNFVAILRCLKRSMK